MIDRAHAGWREGSLAGVLLMDIKAAFASMGRGRLVYSMKAKSIDGDHIRWRATIHSDRTVEMLIVGNVMK